MPWDRQAAVKEYARRLTLAHDAAMLALHDMRPDSVPPVPAGNDPRYPAMLQAAALMITDSDR